MDKMEPMVRMALMVKMVRKEIQASKGRQGRA
jgi:hypothetical protein